MRTPKWDPSPSAWSASETTTRAHYPGRVLSRAVLPIRSFMWHDAEDSAGIERLTVALSAAQTARHVPPIVLKRDRSQAKTSARHLRLVDGAHRLEAARIVGFRRVPVVIVEEE
jgi:hypothetical protein